MRDWVLLRSRSDPRSGAGRDLLRSTRSASEADRLIRFFEKILHYYPIDRLEIGYYCDGLIRFFEKILDYYPIDRLETEHYCPQKIRFFEKILEC